MAGFRVLFFQALAAACLIAAANAKQNALFSRIDAPLTGQSRRLSGAATACDQCVATDKTRGCCNTCCGCCDVGCDDVPCWGCGQATHPTDAQCAASKPKSDPKCRCHPKGVAHHPYKCYTCAGGSCAGVKCIECGDQCTRKPNFGASYDWSHRWHGQAFWIKNVTVKTADGCAAACNKVDLCWKWNENGQGLHQSDRPGAKIKKTCCLFKDAATLQRNRGGVAGKLA